MADTPLATFNGEMELLHTLPAMFDETQNQIRFWTPYKHVRNLPFLRTRRLKVLLQNSRPFPDFDVIQPPSGDSSRWCVYFCYLPDGQIQPCHRYTIAQLVADGITPLVICAAPDAEACKQFAGLPIGGLVWKALNGYDFSGYTIGLEVLATLGRPLSLFVMNDSVLGPFCAIADLFESSPWKMTGLTSSAAVETHLQSYLFHIAQFSAADIPTLQQVFFRTRSFDAQGRVSFLQETRLPSGFKGKFSVGSLIAPSAKLETQYCMLLNPAGLLQAGAPVMKRSIFGKFEALFDKGAYNALLEQYNHPSMI